MSFLSKAITSFVSYFVFGKKYNAAVSDEEVKGNEADAGSMMINDPNRRVVLRRNVVLPMPPMHQENTVPLKRSYDDIPSMYERGICQLQDGHVLDAITTLEHSIHKIPAKEVANTVRFLTTATKQPETLLLFINRGWKTFYRPEDLLKVLGALNFEGYKLRNGCASEPVDLVQKVAMREQGALKKIWDILPIFQAEFPLHSEMIVNTFADSLIRILNSVSDDDFISKPFFTEFRRFVASIGGDQKGAICKALCQVLRGLDFTTSRRASEFLPRLMLIFANFLKEADEFLPQYDGIYDHFLGGWSGFESNRNDFYRKTWMVIDGIVDELRENKKKKLGENAGIEKHRQSNRDEEEERGIDEKILIGQERTKRSEKKRQIDDIEGDVQGSENYYNNDSDDLLVDFVTTLLGKRRKVNAPISRSASSESLNPDTIINTNNTNSNESADNSASESVDMITPISCQSPKSTNRNRQADDSESEKASSEYDNENPDWNSCDSGDDTDIEFSASIKKRLKYIK